MNEKTRQRLESELNVPAPTQPIDKLRLHEAHAVASVGVVPLTGPVVDVRTRDMCFADDE